MNKRTKLAVVVSAIAAVISAIVLIVVFWDKLLDKCASRKLRWDETEPQDADPGPAYNAEELADYADLHPNAE